MAFQTALNDQLTRLTRGERRQALNRGHANALLWAAGNALTTGPMVTYLAQDLGAKGFAISLILAAPMLCGVLRLFTPVLVRRLGSAKRAAIACYSVSYAVMLLLPALGFASPFVARPTALTALIVIICVHQLLEFVATAALWAWWADLVPPRFRGRYFARRQVWQLSVNIPLALASGYFVDMWRKAHGDSSVLLLTGYSFILALGAVLLLASIAPLAQMPVTRRLASGSALDWRLLLTPLIDRRFRRLLLFRSWLSFANGLTQTPQAIFPKAVLKLGVGDLNIMKVVMQLGQMAIATPVGKLGDRYGNRPVLLVAQVCVAASLLFFMIANPLWSGPTTTFTRWLPLGAWILFSAYAAHNICLPNLMLKLAPSTDKSPYVAVHEALASLFHAVGTLAGGAMFDFVDWTQIGILGPHMDRYGYLFLLGLLGRSGAAWLLLFVKESTPRGSALKAS